MIIDARVMGATGSGKSSVRSFSFSKSRIGNSHPRYVQFINLVSGSRLEVSDGLKSCTKDVRMADAFKLNGRSVVLVDTPGFDDTTISDTDILKKIAVFLAATLVYQTLVVSNDSLTSR